MIKTSLLLEKIFNEIKKQYPENLKTFAIKIGISENTLYSLRKLKRLPALDTFVKICEGLKIDPNTILEFPNNSIDLQEKIKILEKTNEILKNENKNLSDQLIKIKEDSSDKLYKMASLLDKLNAMKE